jgi:hypothetical protein
MANLVGQNIGTNYKGLINLGTSVNTPLSATFRVLTDGQGNILPIEVATTGINLTGTAKISNVNIATVTDVAAKQDTLISGTNIKTINGGTLLGSGDIVISGGGGAAWGEITGTLASQTDLQSALNAKENTITATTSADYFRGDKTFATLDKSAVGLANVDNTSDANKPISSATQTALNAKVASNTAIVAATKTKITYDAKGLVTAGVDATTADIADSLNKRYVTDAQSTIIGNTSGANSGDNAVNSLYSGLAASKQDTLISATNIKTINGSTILGSGDLVISGGGSPSGVAGAVQFSDGTNFASDADNFFFDDTNNRLGIGTNAPSATGHFKGSSTTASTTALLVQNSAGTQSFKVADGGSVQIGSTSGINWTFNSNILSSSQYAYIAGNNGVILTNGNFSGGVFGNDNGGKVADSDISTPQVASAVLEVSSTTRGFLPPRMTTTQKNAIATPASGLIVYDTSTNKLACYNGTSWNDLF